VKIFLILLVLAVLSVVGYYYQTAGPKIVSKNSFSVLTCSDTDGYDIYLKGYANFEKDEPGESSFYESPDHCISHPEFGTILREGWCEGNIYKEVRTTCGRGYNCVDGTCVK
jgi:hypothetical protein